MQLLQLDFLRAELHIGLTFATVALTARHPDKVHRNRVNARKAYDSFRRYLPSASLSNVESKELNETAVELKHLLTQLGESL